MRRLLIYGLTLTIGLLPALAKAQESMSLEECIQYALEHQTKIKNARLDQRSTIAKNREVTGLALPNLKLSGGINYAPLVAAFQVPNFIKDGVSGLVFDTVIDPKKAANMPNTLSFAFQPKWTTNGQAELNQMLFDPSIMVALQARKQLEQLAEKNIQLTEQEVRVAVAKAYYNIMIAEKRKELLDQNIARIDQLHRETRVIYENGLAEKLDVDRISITLTNLKTEQTRVKQLVDLTYMALKFQMGMQLDQNIALEDTLTEAVIDKELLSHDLELERRKEYQLLELQKTLNSYDLKRYKLGGLPTLVLFGNYGYTLYNMENLFNPEDKWQKSALIGTKLTVPLFDGMQRRNKMLQAKYTLQKSENDLENLKLALQLEKENARITLQSNISALENQRSNMKLAEEVFNVAKVKYKEGVGSNLEVMNAESALKEAQTNYFSALYDAITSRIDLQKALGEL